MSDKTGTVMILIESYHFLIFLFLGYMAYQDIQTREVSNRIIGAFYVLISPAVAMNYPNLTSIHVGIVLVVVGLYLARMGMGGADLKVLVPFILTMPEGLMYLFIFFTLDAAFAFVVSKNMFKCTKMVPGMVTMCFGYGIVLLIYYLI